MFYIFLDLLWFTDKKSYTLLFVSNAHNFLFSFKKDIAFTNNFLLFYNNQKNNNNWNKFPLKISFNADEDHDDNANENSNWANDSEIDIKKSISLSQ